MSKLDAQRAMREARYAERQQAAAATGKPARRSASRPPVAPPDPTTTPARDTDVPRCGHRNIGGRTCTREQGHSAKNHRYS